MNLRNACGTSNRPLAPSGLAGPTGNGEGGAARGGRLEVGKVITPRLSCCTPRRLPRDLAIDVATSHG